MNKTLPKNNGVEYIEITKMILKGETIPQIAKKLCYSESTVSNRLNDLLEKYNASNRFEFICNFFSNIIKRYKLRLKSAREENIKLENELIKIKEYIECSKNNKLCKNKKCIIFSKIIH